MKTGTSTPKTPIGHRHRALRLESAAGGDFATTPKRRGKGTTAIRDESPTLSQSPENVIWKWNNDSTPIRSATSSSSTPALDKIKSKINHSPRHLKQLRSRAQPERLK